MNRFNIVAVRAICAAVGTAVLELYGCGGGSTGSAPSTSSLKIGQLSVAYQGSAKPFVESGNGSVTVTGMAGAAYSNISLSPAASLDNTLILYSNYSQNADLTEGIYTVNTAGTVNQVSPANIVGVAGAFTNDGHILMSADVPNQGFRLVECNYDGSNPVVFSSTSVSSYQPIACSPTAAKVAWNDGTGKLWVSNFNGSSAVQISSNGSFPAFSPDGSTLAFQALNTGGYDQIYTEPVTGGTATLFPGLVPTYFYRNPAWLPSGTGIMMEEIQASNDYEIAFAMTTGYELYLLASPDATYNDFGGSFAPDGKTVVLNRDSNLVTAQYNGQNPSVIVSQTSEGQPFFAHWSPYPSPQTFVGTTGTLSATAAGFLWGQSGDVFSSLVTFNASTPNSVTVTPQTTGTANGSLIFDVHAASLTSLKYTNGYYALVTSVLSGPSGTTDALVSFNGQTGQVDTIAPFIATRAAVKPAQQGSQLVFQGKFSGIWNGKGKNLAPGGASEVVIDSATGKLVSES